jgi:hypothetical protein
MVSVGDTNALQFEKTSSSKKIFCHFPPEWAGPLVDNAKDVFGDQIPNSDRKRGQIVAKPT